MNEATKQFLVKYYLEQVYTEDYIDWAIACLVDNFDSKDLRILSAMDKFAYKHEVEEKFRRALSEIGFEFPSKKEVLQEYVKDTAKSIVSGATNPAEGCHKIYNVMRFLDYPKELSNWVYLDEGLDPETYEWIYDAFEVGSTQSTDKWFEAIKTEAKKLAENNFS